MSEEKVILLVEDDANIKEVLATQCELDGYRLIWESDGNAGLQRGVAETFDLALLDLHLPGIGGIEICRRLRQAHPSLQIMMLTAAESEIDKVTALDAGADDYVTKPFGIRELMARIRARLRTKSAAGPAVSGSGVLNFGELQIDLERRAAKLGANPIELTALEFDLLAFLACRAGKPASRAEILREVWGVDAAGYEDNVNQIVRRLRKKIEVDPEQPQLLLTSRGVGYVFRESD